jgi:hypothetical protein
MPYSMNVTYNFAGFIILLRHLDWPGRYLVIFPEGYAIYLPVSARNESSIANLAVH